MHRRHWLVSLVLFTPICLSLGSPPTRAQEPAAPNPEAATFEALAKGFQQLFNEGKAAELAAHFLPEGELIDDEGNLYRGRAELQDLFERFFATFPGAKLQLQVDSLRMIGPRLAIEEGTRVVTIDERGQRQRTGNWEREAGSSHYQRAGGWRGNCRQWSRAGLHQTG
jgi:uncharacterized protein (TIGR02246 family)